MNKYGLSTPMLRLHSLSSPHRSAPRQAGFTLVELLVGMILLAIFGGILISIVIDAFSSTERSSAARKIEAQATAAIEQLGNDLRSARAADRVATEIGGNDVLRDAVKRNSKLRSRRDNAALDIEDVVSAEPRSVVFQTNAVSESTGVQVPECVTYAVRARAGSWSLVREVRAHPRRGSGSCGTNGRVLSTTTLTPPVNGAAPAVFRYQTVTDACQPAVRDRVNDVRKVMGVHVDLTVLSSRNNVATSQRLASTVSIRSRQEYDYQYALGCVQ